MAAAKKCLRSNEGKDALNYLVNERGISETVIDQFDFGYCPAYVNHELKDRIITPIYDSYGRLMFLSSRILRTKDFWHESINKSLFLFGIQIAKDNIVKHKKAIIVEGEYDVGFLHSHGINIAIAVCGSALSLFQISLLSRYCSEIYYVTDGDLAGEKSLDRAMKLYRDNALDQWGIKLIPVKLPNGKDPDDYVKENGSSGFINLLKEAREKMNYKKDNFDVE